MDPRVLLFAVCSLALGCQSVLGIDDWKSSTTSTGTGGGEGSGGSAGSGGEAISSCGKTTLLADEFDAGNIDGRTWTIVEGGGSGQAQQQNGALLLTPAAIAGASMGVASTRYFDLRDSSVVVGIGEVPDSGHPDDVAELIVGLEDERLVMQDHGGQLAALAWVSGSLETIHATSYEVTKHAFWRIREQAGAVYWETSADGTSFDAFAEGPASFPLDVVRVELRAWTTGMGLPPEPSSFAQLNGGAPSGKHCPATSLVDDFEEPAMATVWASTPEPQLCAQAEVGGALVLTPIGGEIARCKYVSARDYDLRNSSIVVEVGKVVNSSPTTYQRVRLVSGSEAYVDLYLEQGKLHWAYADGGAPIVETTDFEPDAHRFWRISESAGVLRWEASADGLMWTRLDEMSTPLDVSRVQVLLGAGTDSVPDPGIGEFAGVNVLP